MTSILSMIVVCILSNNGNCSQCADCCQVYEWFMLFDSLLANNMKDLEAAKKILKIETAEIGRMRNFGFIEKVHWEGGGEVWDDAELVSPPRWQITSSCPTFWLETNEKVELMSKVPYGRVFDEFNVAYQAWLRASNWFLSNFIVNRTAK